MTLRTALFSLALACVMLLTGALPALSLGEQERAADESGEAPDALDNAKRLSRGQGEFSEGTAQALRGTEAKAGTPQGTTRGGGMGAPSTAPAKGGKAIYGDIVIHK